MQASGEDTAKQGKYLPSTCCYTHLLMLKGTSLGHTLIKSKVKLH